MAGNKFGRMLITVGLFLLFMLFAWEATATEPQIIEIRRNIPLSDQEPVYKDYYINAGTDTGFKLNQVVTVVRKMNLRDASGNQSFGELLVPVGQIKVIFVQNRLAVAREYKLLGREDLPMLEQTAVMTGDVIDLKGAFIDNRKPSAKTTAEKESTSPAAESTEVADSQREALQSVTEAFVRVSSQ